MSRAVEGPLAPVVIVAVSLVSAGFVITGLLWLFGEARVGFRGGRG